MDHRSSRRPPSTPAAEPAGGIGLPAIPGVEDLTVIGRGGSGVVYRGRQPALGRDVAVKVISAPSASGSAAARWQREITAMGRLSNHPNIVAVHDGGVTDDGRPYLVMPYVPGGSLSDGIKRTGTLAPNEVATLGAKLAGALASAHEAGVLHRDVKPDNVLLSPYGEPQLSDFGIARLIDSTATTTGSIHATVPFAAPEVLSGEPATEAADVYGLAATLYACLTGTPPFPSFPDESVIALAGRIVSQPPPDLATTGVPAELAAVISAGLAKTPGGRIATADALRRRLDGAAEAMADSGTARTAELRVPAAASALEPTPADDRAHYYLPRARRARNRGPGAAVVAVVLLIGLAAAGIGYAVTRDSGEDIAAPTSTVPAPAAPPATDGESAPEDAPQPTTTPPVTEPAGDDGDEEADVDPPTGGIATTATRYFASIGEGDLGGSYQLLSPEFQAAQSQESYEAFWSSQSVEVVGELSVDEDSQTATVPLAINGQREDFPLSFVPDGDGGWLIDGPRPG